MSGVPLGGATWAFRTPRLYRKTSGVYFVRVLFGPDHLDAAQHGQTKRELRTSLRTKDPRVARTLASYINAQLAQCADMTNRQALWPDISHTISTWTLPGGISCNGEEDRRSLTQFLRDHPGLERALAKHIERSSTPLATASAIAPLRPLHRRRSSRPRQTPTPIRAVAATAALLDALRSHLRPCLWLRRSMSEAIEKFRRSATRHRGQQPANPSRQRVPVDRLGRLHVPSPTYSGRRLLLARRQRPAPERLHQRTGEVARESSRKGQHQEQARAANDGGVGGTGGDPPPRSA